MPYGGDPSRNPLDKVRFLLGDTNNGQLFLTDDEVHFLLSEENGSELRAAARGAEALASKFSTAVVEKQVGPLRISSGTRGLTKAERYLELAKALWRRAARRSAVPWAGGIEVTDKNERRADLERVKPAFSRTMMEYPPGWPQQNQTSENTKVR